MTFFLLPVVQTNAEHVHCLCIATFKMLLQHLTCFFCWHFFSLLFHVNKVLWDPGILRPPLLYPFGKDPNFNTARLSSCFQTCKLSTGGMLQHLEGLVALCLHPWMNWWDRTRTVMCVVYELDSSSQVFLPLCHALVVVRLNVLFFFSESSN